MREYVVRCVTRERVTVEIAVSFHHTQPTALYSCCHIHHPDCKPHRIISTLFKNYGPPQNRLDDFAAEVCCCL